MQLEGLSTVSSIHGFAGQLDVSIEMKAFKVGG